MQSWMSTLGSGIGQSASNAFDAGGAVIGGITNRIANEKRMNRQQDALEAAIARGDTTYGEIESMYSPYVEGGQKAYDSLWSEYDSLKNADPVAEYSPDDVNKWLDPSLDFQAEMAQRSLGASQGGSGDYLSSSGMQEMMEQNRKIGETGWGNARDFGYKSYLDKIANDRTDLSNRVNLLQSFNTQGQNALNNTASAKMNYADQANQLGLTKDFINAEQSTLPIQMWGGFGQTAMDLGSADSQVFGNMVGSMGGQQPVQGDTNDIGASSANWGAQSQPQGNLISNQAGTGNTGTGNILNTFGSTPAQDSFNTNLDGSGTNLIG